MHFDYLNLNGATEVRKCGAKSGEQDIVSKKEGVRMKGWRTSRNPFAVLSPDAEEEEEEEEEEEREEEDSSDESNDESNSRSSDSGTDNTTDSKKRQRQTEKKKKKRKRKRKKKQDKKERRSNNDDGMEIDVPEDAMKMKVVRKRRRLGGKANGDDGRGVKRKRKSSRL